MKKRIFSTDRSGAQSRHQKAQKRDFLAKHGRKN